MPPKEDWDKCNLYKLMYYESILTMSLCLDEPNEEKEEEKIVGTRHAITDHLDCSLTHSSF